MKWLGIIVAIIVAVGAWWFLVNAPAPVTPPPTTSEIITGVPNTTHTNSQLGFSLESPSTAITSQVQFDGYLPVTQTPVASFVLPSSLSAGTNLSEAGVYIGATTSPMIVSACTLPTQGVGETSVGTESINGTTFSVFTSSDAGAGNFYQSKTYRTLDNGTCLEIVELLHSGNINNYPEGTVTEFDHAKFSGILEAIVHSYKPL